MHSNVGVYGNVCECVGLYEGAGMCESIGLVELVWACMSVSLCECVGVCEGVWYVRVNGGV